MINSFQTALEEKVILLSRSFATDFMMYINKHLLMYYVALRYITLHYIFLHVRIIEKRKLHF